MSANNWGICPKCKARHAAAIVAAEQALADAYGRVTADDYVAMMDTVANIREEPLEQTLREDYEIRVDEDGLFEAHYTGACSRCTFSFGFQHKEQALGEAPE